jgi:hypothetical protein
MFPAVEHFYACVRSNFDSATRTSVGLLTSSFASGLRPSFLGCGPISIAVFLSCLESTCATNFSFSTCGQAHQTACADFVFSLLAFNLPQEHQAWCRFLVFAAASDQLPPFLCSTCAHQSQLLFFTGPPRRNQLLSTGLVSVFTILRLLSASVFFFPLMV